MKGYSNENLKNMTQFYYISLNLDKGVQIQLYSAETYEVSI